MMKSEDWRWLDLPGDTAGAELFKVAIGYFLLAPTLHHSTTQHQRDSWDLLSSSQYVDNLKLMKRFQRNCFVKQNGDLSH